MDVTKVRIDKLTPDEKIKATVTVFLDDVLCIHQMHVIDGDQGLFVGYPNTGDMKFFSNRKRFVDIVHPCNNELRDKIQSKVIEKYNKVVSNQ